MDNQSLKPTKDQIIYANLLLLGMVTGIIVLAVTYAIYVIGLLPSHVDMHLIAANWGKGVHDYLEITHSPHGWGWIALLGKGDFLNYIGFTPAGRLDHHLLPGAGQGILPAEELDIFCHQHFGNCRFISGGIRNSGQRRGIERRHTMA